LTDIAVVSAIVKSDAGAEMLKAFAIDQEGAIILDLPQAAFAIDYESLLLFRWVCRNRESLEKDLATLEDLEAIRREPKHRNAKYGVERCLLVGDVIFGVDENGKFGFGYGSKTGEFAVKPWEAIDEAECFSPSWKNGITANVTTNPQYRPESVFRPDLITRLPKPLGNCAFTNAKCEINTSRTVLNCQPMLGCAGPF
jgi:hypothetical protein